MRPRNLSAKIAFLVVPLFTISWQCAAQCIAQPCQELETKVPPCHRQHSTKKGIPSHSCKASLLVAEEVRTQSNQDPATHPWFPVPAVLSRPIGTQLLVSKLAAGDWLSAPRPLSSAPATSPLRI